MRAIIIARNHDEAERYAQQHGWTLHEWAYRHPAVGCHYDRVVLAGHWLELPDLHQLVDWALASVWRPQATPELTQLSNERQAIVNRPSSSSQRIEPEPLVLSYKPDSPEQYRSRLYR